MKDPDRAWLWDRRRSRTHYLPRPDGMTLEAVAAEMGITKAGAKKIQDRALAKIRRALEVKT